MFVHFPKTCIVVCTCLLHLACTLCWILFPELCDLIWWLHSSNRVFEPRGFPCLCLPLSGGSNYVVTSHNLRRIMCHIVSPGHGTLQQTSASVIIIPFIFPSHPTTLFNFPGNRSSDCLKFWTDIVNSKYNDTSFNVKPETVQTLNSKQNKYGKKIHSFISLVLCFTFRMKKTCKIPS